MSNRLTVKYIQFEDEVEEKEDVYKSTGNFNFLCSPLFQAYIFRTQSFVQKYSFPLSGGLQAHTQQGPWEENLLANES